MSCVNRAAETRLSAAIAMSLLPFLPSLERRNRSVGTEVLESRFSPVGEDQSPASHLDITMEMKFFHHHGKEGGLLLFTFPPVDKAGVARKGFLPFWALKIPFKNAPIPMAESPMYLELAEGCAKQISLINKIKLLLCNCLA